MGLWCQEAGSAGRVAPEEMRLHLLFLLWYNLQELPFAVCIWSTSLTVSKLRMKHELQNSQLTLGSLGWWEEHWEAQVWSVIWSVVVLIAKIWLLQSAFSIKKIVRRCCTFFKAAFWDALLKWWTCGYYFLYTKTVKYLSEIVKAARESHHFNCTVSVLLAGSVQRVTIQLCKEINRTD